MRFAITFLLFLSIRIDVASLPLVREATSKISLSETPAYSIADEQREILYRITEAEVTGEGNFEYYKAKRNVASCVINRWQTGWGDTIEDVVFAKNQFSPINDGRYFTVNVTAQTRRAVDDVLKNGTTHDCIYFCTRTCSSYTSGFHSTLTHVFDDIEHAYMK